MLRAAPSTLFYLLVKEEVCKYHVNSSSLMYWHEPFLVLVKLNSISLMGLENLTDDRLMMAVGVESKCQKSRILRANWHNFHSKTKVISRKNLVNSVKNEGFWGAKTDFFSKAWTGQRRSLIRILNFSTVLSDQNWCEIRWKENFLTAFMLIFKLFRQKALNFVRVFLEWWLVPWALEKL